MRNFFKLKTTDRHSLLMFVYLVSTLVKVLEANAMGCMFCVSAAPKPHSLASVCISTGFVQS